MPSNSKTKSNNAEQNETMDVQTAQRVEQEKMTRRSALRKLGFGAGLAAFSLLGADDLARMVGRRMERMEGDNKVARQVAKEFQSAGIALANPSSGGGSGGATCQHCYNEGLNEFCWCENMYGGNPDSPSSTSEDKESRCNTQASDNTQLCMKRCTGSVVMGGTCSTMTEPPGWSG